MATPRFNSNIITTAHRLKDLRTDATAAGDSGMRFTSVILSGYENLAIKSIVLELVQQLGKDIGDSVPQLVKDSGVLTFVAGVAPKPVDSLLFLELRKSDSSYIFTKITENISRIKAGKDIWVPTATKPAFYEDAVSLYCLPVGTDAVIGRYIIAPSDIIPSTAGAGSGGAATTITSYTSSTKVLIAASSIFVATDIGKIVAFGAGAATYIGRIGVYTSGTTVTLGEGFLPVGSLGAGGSLVMVSDSPSGDVILPSVWDAMIVERMVAFGLKDMAADASLG